MKRQTLETYRERILRVLVHVQSHLDEPLALPDLAAVAHFSPYHFHRIFSGMVGESVKEHVRRLRLERAAHRLRFTDQPVTGIAFDAGFEAHEAFTRAFRAMFEASPSEYRKQHRSIAAPPSPSGVHYAADGAVEGFEPVPEGDKPMNVRIEEIKPMHVAFIRHVGPYDQVGQAWTRLMGWPLRRRGFWDRRGSRARSSAGLFMRTGYPNSYRHSAGKRRVYKHLRIFRAVFRRRAHNPDSSSRIGPL